MPFSPTGHLLKIQRIESVFLRDGTITEDDWLRLIVAEAEYVSVALTSRDDVDCECSCGHLTDSALISIDRRWRSKRGSSRLHLTLATADGDYMLTEIPMHATAAEE